MTAPATPPEPTRRPEVDEVLRRTGRNLLLFQQIEHLLKRLIGMARFQGAAATIAANLHDRQAGIHRQALGHIAERSIASIRPSNGPSGHSHRPVGERARDTAGCRRTLQWHANAALQRHRQRPTHVPALTLG